MKKSFPKVVIVYNKMLDPIFIFYSQNSEHGKRLKWDLWTPPDEKEIKRRIRQYRKAWLPFEKPFFDMMEKLTNTPCVNKIIDVHIVSGSPRQIGSPIIIKSGFSKDEFVITLVHELIHYYINIHHLPASFKNNKNTNNTHLTRKHIVVFSILKYFFNDVIRQPQLTSQAKEMSKKHETNEYLRAWEYAEKNYLKVIKTFSKILKRNKIF